jgi:hypothetical protein
MASLLDWGIGGINAIDNTFRVPQTEATKAVTDSKRKFLKITTSLKNYIMVLEYTMGILGFVYGVIVYMTSKFYENPEVNQ